MSDTTHTARDHSINDAKYKENNDIIGFHFVILPDNAGGADTVVPREILERNIRSILCLRI